MTLDQNKVSFYSGALIDKPVYTKSDTFTIGSANVAGYLYRLTIPHTIGRPMFMDGNFAYNGNNTMNGYEFIVYSDANNIYILTYGTAGKTVTYNIVGQWIDDYDDTNPDVTPQFLAATSTNLAFDSRKNYRKVAAHGQIPIISNTSQSVSNPTKKITQYQLYFNSFSGQVWPQISGGVNDIWLYDIDNQNEVSAYVDAADLHIEVSTYQQPMNVWYRIYY